SIFPASTDARVHAGGGKLVCSYRDVTAAMRAPPSLLGTPLHSAAFTLFSSFVA
ncbi:hypothetical protein J6590_098891, partial [Homalodisca vitripennis]